MLKSLDANSMSARPAMNTCLHKPTSYPLRPFVSSTVCLPIYNYLYPPTCQPIPTCLPTHPLPHTCSPTYPPPYPPTCLLSYPPMIPTELEHFTTGKKNPQHLHVIRPQKYRCSSKGENLPMSYLHMCLPCLCLCLTGWLRPPNTKSITTYAHIATMARATHQRHDRMPSDRRSPARPWTASTAPTAQTAVRAN